jgi:hypothetical protein
MVTTPAVRTLQRGLKGGSSDYLIPEASDGESGLDLYGGLRGTRLTHRGVWELAKQNGALACFVKRHMGWVDLDRAIQTLLFWVGCCPRKIGIGISSFFLFSEEADPK